MDWLANGIRFVRSFYIRMPHRPEYLEKIDEMLFFIGDYANLLPYHPNNVEIENKLRTQINRIKGEISDLIKTESDELKGYVRTIYNNFLFLQTEWGYAQEMWNQPE